MQPDTQNVLSSEQRAAIVAAARSLIGTPFQHQGRDESVGVDCQGFVHAVCARVGYRLSDWPNNHRRYGNDELLRQALEIDFICTKGKSFFGDLMLIELPRRRNLHVGILAEGKEYKELIHALGFDNKGEVKADRFSRWKLITTYTWRPDRFNRPAAA